MDPDACRTRSRAGHKTIQADIAETSPSLFAGRTVGLIASPPCQDFSSAGNRKGVAGTSGHLVGQVIRWADKLSPDWIALEEVPSVLPIWNDFSEHFRATGYSTWVGIMNAADYGVPQTRKRAVLIASRSRVVTQPIQTHSNDDTSTLRRWLPIASVVSHDPRDRVLSTGRDWKKGGTRDDAQRVSFDRPCPTITRQASAWQWRRTDRSNPDPIRFSLTEALAFQSFPHGYPVFGTRSGAMLQIGNAVPPLMAAHILAEAIGLSFSGPETPQR